MTNNDFSISIGKEAVEVRHIPSTTSPNGKLFGFLLNVGMIVAVNCFLLFMPGKHDRPSMWEDIQAGSYIFPTVLLTAGTAFLAWSGFRYARAAWPSDEIFYCDRHELTISRTPWWDFHNHHWNKYVYPLTDVSHLRFAAIASLKNKTFYGIRFLARGRRWALPGLEAPEAKRILIALKSLGADVPEDPKLEKRISQALEMRDGDTSWMDRSWMADDSKTPTDKS